MTAETIVQKFMQEARRPVSALNLRALARQLCVNALGLGCTNGLEELVSDVFSRLQVEWSENRLQGDGRRFYVRTAT